MHTTSRKIGAHVSAAGGLDKAVERAAAIGATSVQVFSGSPRVWRRTPLADIDEQKMLAKRQELQVDPVITHSLYLINLASDNPELIRKSIEALQYDLAFDAKIQGSGVVVHLGSHNGRGWEAVKDAVVTSLSTILENSPDNSTFLIENSAGQQGKLASDLSHIRWLLDAVKSPRLRWCLDTCHAWAAGYALSELSSELRSAENKNQPRGVLPEEITRYNLWASLGCVHVNDSKDPFASGRDRHDNLGDGTILPEQFARFLNLPELTTLPLILEVPGLDGAGPDSENIQRLKKILIN